MIPALMTVPIATISNFSAALQRGMALNPILAQIPPDWVGGPDELWFQAPAPFLDLFFSFQCGFDITSFLIIDKPGDVVFFGKSID